MARLRLQRSVRHVTVLKDLHLSCGLSENRIPYSGWWFQPLWKMWKLVGMIIPNIYIYIWKNKIHVPNHQPAIPFIGWYHNCPKAIHWAQTWQTSCCYAHVVFFRANRDFSNMGVAWGAVLGAYKQKGDTYCWCLFFKDLKATGSRSIGKFFVTSSHPIEKHGSNIKDMMWDHINNITKHEA
jgi:hypothetical protein